MVCHDNAEFFYTSTRRVMNFNNADAFGSILFHLYCRDKVLAVHMLRRDGFDVFIDKVVEIIWR